MAEMETDKKVLSFHRLQNNYKILAFKFVQL